MSRKPKTDRRETWAQELADLLATTKEAGPYSLHRRDEILEALDRVREGTYGLCRDCGRKISADRLRVKPEASRCVRCQRKAEGSRAA